MKIKLNKLGIQNLKGVKSFVVDFNGGNATIKAENGRGKTTVYDGFLWLFFGKNSEGKKDFGVRPLDADNQPIKGLVVAVKASLDCDGTVHTFRKEQHEKVVKGQLRGYEVSCWIDEVPTKIGEYADYIAELIPEDTFKMLTDLSYFNGKLHWTDRRKVLLDIAGETATPEGFDELIAVLNGRSVADYKKVLSEQKKLHDKERKEINPRIDEIKKGMGEDTDVDELVTKRDALKEDIAKLNTVKQGIFDTENERLKLVDALNALKMKKSEREAALKNDTTGISNFLDEKAAIETNISVLKDGVFKAKENWTAKTTLISSVKNKLSAKISDRNSVYEEWKKIDGAKTDDTCYACKQELPDGMKVKVEEEREKKLIEVTRRGNLIKAEITAIEKEIVKLGTELTTVNEAGEEVHAKLKAAIESRSKRFTEIDKLIESNETTKPENDPMWKAICFDMKKLEKKIGEPASEQLEKVEGEIAKKNITLTDLNNALAQSDRAEKDKARIKELGEKEKELAQKIADLEKQLAEIDKYNAEQSGLVESAVNGKFKHVEFKMFNTLLNGVIEECCEATFKGVPYADMSMGEQIYCGIDIVNVLSDHYGVSVPLFLDKAEGLTLPVETESQTIKLFAKPETKKLIVEVEGELPDGS